MGSFNPDDVLERLKNGLQVLPDELQQLREGQAAQCKAMDKHETIAYLRGFPPGERCAANPRQFQIDLEKGNIEPEKTPLALLREKLEATYGPQVEATIRLSMSFAEKVSGAISENDSSFPFKLDFKGNP